MVFTTTSMTTVRVSMRKAQLAVKAPEFTQRRISTFASCPSWRKPRNTIQDKTAETQSRPVVRYMGQAGPS